MNLLESIKGAGVTTSIKLQEHSPEILMGAGAVTFVGAIVTACMATVKAVDVAEEHRIEIGEVKGTIDDPEVQKKEISKVYLHTGVKMAKLYAAPAVLSVTSLGMMFGANHILKERNAAIASAYTALSAAYKKYRKAVIDKYGEEEDYKLLHGVREEEYEEEYADKKGNVKTRKKKETLVDPDGPALYTRYFTKTNDYWKSTDDLIEFELGCRERLLNDALYRKGFISFNEALEMFGFERVDDGMVTGWIYDKENPTGDNYIQVRRHKERMIGSRGVPEDVWVLDFNVDGNIYNIMQTRKHEKQKKFKFKED